MNNWQDITFNIPKHTDEAVHAAISKAFKEAAISPGYTNFHPFDGKAICCVDQDPETNVEVTDLFVLKDCKIREFDYCIAGDDSEAALLSVTRCENDSYDQVLISLSKLNQMSAEVSAGVVLNLVLSAETHLQKLQADTYGIARTFSQIRLSFDQELSRIKAMFDEKQAEDFAEKNRAVENLKASHQLALNKIEVNLEHNKQDYQRQVEHKKQDNQRQALVHRELAEKTRADHKHDQDKTLHDHQNEVKGLNEKHAKEIDRLKHNRERIDALRKDFREGVADRSQKFGNRMAGIEHPVFIVHLLLLIGFGGIAVFGFYQLINNALPGESGDTVTIYAVLFSLAFLITTASVARWYKDWRRQQDARELELLRMSLDVERMYLAVEMALEAKSKSGEMSDELLEKLFVKTSQQAD